MNCAFSIKYNPASEQKFRTRNKAEITGLGRVIINTAEIAQIVANVMNKNTSSAISLEYLLSKVKKLRSISINHSRKGIASLKWSNPQIQLTFFPIQYQIQHEERFRIFVNPDTIQKLPEEDCVLLFCLIIHPDYLLLTSTDYFTVTFSARTSTANATFGFSGSRFI